MTKRILDICLAIIALVPAAFLIGLAALWVKLESPGPAIFRQLRVGRNQKPFTLLKLRTMYLDTDDKASHETPVSQITKAGKFLRRTKIDELPQIWSVLIGDMSFVGPRPCLPTQNELISARNERDVFSVLPGITGPAQLAKVDMSTPVTLANLDGKYVLERSIKWDIAIIWATAFGKGSGDAVK